jgi:hypothetical protein
MSQTVRVLAESDQPVPVAELRTILPGKTELIIEEGNDSSWSQLLLRHVDGSEIALVEREVVAPGQWGEQELTELLREVEESRPLRAVEWLKHYFRHVKVVYAMQLLSGIKVNDAWAAVFRIQAYFWKKLGGILQADGEGFSNREGQHILWQFHGPQTGDLDVAVLNDAGEWKLFTLNMSNAAEVEAFQRGEIPTREKHA